MSDAITRGRKALQRIHQRNDDAQYTFATVGRMVDGVAVFDVTGRPGYIFVTIRQSNGSQTSPPARNDSGVPKALGLPVRLRREGTTYIIDGLAMRSDLAYTSPGQDPAIHLHDNRYFTETEHVSVSAGAGDAGKPIVLDAGGHVDVTMINGADIAAKIHAATLDTTPLDADEVPSLDSSASFGLLRTTWTSIKAFLKTYFDGLYFIVAGKAGGQTAYGGTGSGDDLTLQSTAHATKGDLLLPDNIVKFGDGLAALSVQFNGAAATTRDFAMMSAGVFRWLFRVDSTAESGSNAGSDFSIAARADDGSALFNALHIARATGWVGLRTAASAALHVLQATLGQPVFWLGSTATGTDPNVVVYQGRVATTNATVTTLHTFAIATDQVVLLRVQVLARRTAGGSGTGAIGDGAWFKIEGAYQNVGGTVSLIQTSDTIGKVSASAVAWTVVFTISGTNVLLQVTGAASMTVTWHLEKAEVSNIAT